MYHQLWYILCSVNDLVHIFLSKTVVFTETEFCEKLTILAIFLFRYSKLKTYFEYELLSIDESSNTATFQYSSKSAQQGQLPTCIM
jgi:hypothetical protein